MTTRMFGHLVVPTLSASAKRSAVVTRHLGWMALGIVSSPATAIALCESNNENNNTPSILDTIFPKDDNGKIYWEKASKQVTESIFWDKLAKAAGQKVRQSFEPSM